MPNINYFDVEKVDWSISGLSKGILSITNPDKIAEIRRRNYQYLRNALFNIPTLQLHLSNDVCTLSFPVFVKDRSRWCKAFNAKCILVVEWRAGYHRGFDYEEFPEARYLKNNFFTLAVHQRLDVNHMGYIACKFSELPDSLCIGD